MVIVLLLYFSCLVGWCLLGAYLSAYLSAYPSRYPIGNIMVKLSTFYLLLGSPFEGTLIFLFTSMAHYYESEVQNLAQFKCTYQIW